MIPGARGISLPRVPRACLSFACDHGQQAQPALLVWHGDRYLIGIPQKAEYGPGPGQEVVLLIDEGIHFFDLRALYNRGRVAPVEAPKEVQASCTWFEMVPLKMVTWDYGTLREVKMRPDDPSVLTVLQRSMVARIATLSHNGRPSINPPYFIFSNGSIWLGTVEWTLAARNAKADPRVSVLFEVEQDPRSRRVLRISGQASVRTERRMQRSYAWRVARKYVLTPGGIGN